jgi:hypothetical protein
MINVLIAKPFNAIWEVGYERRLMNSTQGVALL